jgi:hypothetical protein
MESPEDRLDRELEEQGGQRLSEHEVGRADRLDDGELAEEDVLPGDED